MVIYRMNLCTASRKARLAIPGEMPAIGNLNGVGHAPLRLQAIAHLLIVRATSIIKQARRVLAVPKWIVVLLARCPYKVVAVALANKIARTIWALLVKGGTYQIPTVMAKAKALISFPGHGHWEGTQGARMLMNLQGQHPDTIQTA